MGLTELIEKVKQNDQQAFEELYGQYYQMGFSLARQFVKNEDEAMDIMQDVFITVYSKLELLDDATKFKSWYMQIVANKCRDFLKKQKPLSFTDANAYDEEGALQFEIEETDRDFIPEEAVDYSETVRVVDQMIAELPEEQRMCILLYFANDMKISEIADALGVSEATVKSRLKYGKDKIRDKAEAYQKRTGTKLYSITGLALIPFIRWMLQNKEVSAPVSPSDTFAKVMDAISANGSSAAQSAATLLDQSSAMAQNAHSSVSGIQRLYSAISKIIPNFSNLNSTQQVVSVVVAGTLVAGATVGVASTVILSKNKDTPTTPTTSYYEETLPMRQLDLSDYITVEYSGFSGEATASLQVDASALTDSIGKAEIGEFLAEIDGADKTLSIESLLEFQLSYDAPLSNGDKITMTVTPTANLTAAGTSIEDIMDRLRIDFDTSVIFTVSGLEEYQEIDIFAMVKDYIYYSGSNGYAYAYFNFPAGYQQTVSDNISLVFSTADVTVYIDGEAIGTIDISLIAPNPIVEIEGDLEFVFNENGPLSNGETLSIELGDYYLEEITEKLKPLGYTIETTSFGLTVSGL